MRADIASAVKETLLSSTRKLDQSIARVLDKGEPEAAALYRRLAGKVMGLIHTNLLMPIYREHPDLEPPGLRNPTTPRPYLTPDLSDEILRLASEVDGEIRESLRRIDSGDPAEMNEYRKDAEDILQALRDTEMFVKHVRTKQER